jgi:hypothetical protein
VSDCDECEYYTPGWRHEECAGCKRNPRLDDNFKQKEFKCHQCKRVIPEYPEHRAYGNRVCRECYDSLEARDLARREPL